MTAKGTTRETVSLALTGSGGAGVMIELAADGGWPRADQPVRRYYSGRNTTAWKAMQVSGRVPTEWTVVTRDLWQDCGEFVLTDIAPTAMGGAALFDRIELLRSLDPSFQPSNCGGCLGSGCPSRLDIYDSK